MGRPDALALRKTESAIWQLSVKALVTRPRLAAADRGLRLFEPRKIRCHARAWRRQEVFVPIFRSGPASNGRLARSHRDGVVRVRTAKGRDMYHNRLAQL